jgi:GNAT superfamily N-acetyltransferase
MIELKIIKSGEQIEQVRILFKEYARTLDFDLYFQDFDNELVNLPGEYSLPEGCLLLALYSGKIAGCAALRQIDQKTCEMKRMFVRPNFRRKGIGRAMAEHLVNFARGYGYERMMLDTIDTMKPAVSLYSSLGFCNAAPYRYNPIKGVAYMELRLKP